MDCCIPSGGFSLRGKTKLRSAKGGLTNWIGVRLENPDKLRGMIIKFMDMLCKIKQRESSRLDI